MVQHTANFFTDLLQAICDLVVSLIPHASSNPIITEKVNNVMRKFSDHVNTSTKTYAKVTLPQVIPTTSTTTQPRNNIVSASNQPEPPSKTNQPDNSRAHWDNSSTLPKTPLTSTHSSKRDRQSTDNSRTLPHPKALDSVAESSMIRADEAKR